MHPDEDPIATVDGYVDGFRFARFADAILPAGPPLIPAGRGFVHGEERRRLLDYLRGAPMVVRSDGDAPDLFARGRDRSVPNGWRTDGEWIWSEAIEYYLDRYGVAPEPDLRGRIVERAYRPPAVAAATLQRAAQAVHHWRSSMRTPATADLDDAAGAAGFDPATRRVLRDGGWFPGRDVTSEVDAWLVRLLASEESLADRPDALASARRVLGEFGGVYCQIHGPGQQRALTPFGFFPDPDPQAELPDAFASESLEDRVGVPLFPIGFAPEYRQLIVIAPDGRVFLTGHAVDFLAGVDIATAIAAMALGLALEPVGTP
jgi:hypothetical protein